MSRLSIRFALILGAGMLFVAATVVCDRPVSGQEAGTTSLNIVTVDGVKLKAHYYESTKRNSPVVIMLHPIGEGKSSKAVEWKALAETLHKAGHSVMMFDFRGHGDSTTIDLPEFWTIPMNRSYVKAKDKETIEVKDYINSSAYLPVLVNDIAAVKAYLDRRHDMGSCNTGNTIVIGAENGATLGAIWINSEWNRYKMTPPVNMFSRPTVDKRAEANDIIAAVFLTIQPSLTPKRSVKLTSILSNACRINGMPATFFYGDKDTKARDFAKTLETSLKPKDSKKHKFIGGVELRGDTNLAGVKLLQKGLGTDKAILDYLESVVAERGNEWLERDYQNNHYIWRDPRTQQPLPSRKKGERNLQFSSYELYAQ